MKAWETSPCTTIVVDFEYNIGLFPVLQQNAVWEIAIANANGDWSPLLNTRASSYTSRIGARAWVWATGQKRYQVIHPVVETF